MKRLALIAILTFTITQITLAQAGAAAASRPGPGAAAGLNLNFYTTQYDAMAQQLTLTDAQLAALKSKIDAMNREITSFQQNAPAQLTAARQAARGSPAGPRGAAAAAIIKLQDDLQLLINQHQVRIDQELTPDQQLQWETYKLNRLIDPRIQALTLTDDQRDKIKTLIDDTATAICKLTDGAAITTLQGQLFRKLTADILTDAQLGKLLLGPLPVQRARGPATLPAPRAPILP